MPLLTSADFDAAQVDFVPLSLRDVKLQKSDVLWSDIGGMHHYSGCGYAYKHSN
jgi:peroxin-1